MVVVILPPRHHWISKGGTMIDYVKEVNDYGRKLEPVAKQVARDVFSQLLEEGKDYEWLYFAVMNLGQRDIARYRNLFLYKPFQEEVAAMVAANQEAQERKRRESEQICADIDEWIRKWQNREVIEVKIKRPKRQIKTLEEMLAEVDMLEDDE